MTPHAPRRGQMRSFGALAAAFAALASCGMPTPALAAPSPTEPAAAPPSAPAVPTAPLTTNLEVPPGTIGIYHDAAHTMPLGVVSAVTSGSRTWSWVKHAFSDSAGNNLTKLFLFTDVSPAINTPGSTCKVKVKDFPPAIEKHQGLPAGQWYDVKRYEAPKAKTTATLGYLHRRANGDLSWWCVSTALPGTATHCPEGAYFKLPAGDYLHLTAMTAKPAEINGSTTLDTAEPAASTGTCVP